MALQPHQQRVVEEKAELDERIKKLKQNPACSDVPPTEKTLLQRQLILMRQLQKVLHERIAGFGHP
jgi:uncharacterized protein YdcH (DUF465 family)